MMARWVREASLTHLQVQPVQAGNTLDLDNGGVSGLAYSPATHFGFQQATPGPIRHRSWYRARSPRFKTQVPDSLNLTSMPTIPDRGLSISSCNDSIPQSRLDVKLEVREQRLHHRRLGAEPYDACRLFSTFE
jgi:hypothetical protein